MLDGTDITFMPQHVNGAKDIGRLLSGSDERNCTGDDVLKKIWLWLASRQRLHKANFSSGVRQERRADVP